MHAIKNLPWSLAYDFMVRTGKTVQLIFQLLIRNKPRKWLIHSKQRLASVGCS
jgi:hypothetical protein